MDTHVAVASVEGPALNRETLAAMLEQYGIHPGHRAERTEPAARKLALVNRDGLSIAYLHPDPDRDLVAMSIDAADGALDFDLGDLDDKELFGQILDELGAGNVDVLVRSLAGRRRTATRLRCGEVETGISAPLFSALLRGRWERLEPVTAVVEL